VSAARKLIEVDNVVAIIGGVCSSETLAAGPIAQEAGIMMLAP
jgi:branched-chain amino acid transport system substrate-binding protein